MAPTPKRSDFEARLALLRGYLDCLNGLLPPSQAEFESDAVVSGAARYYLICSMLCALDATRQAIAFRGCRIPREFQDVFNVLYEEGLIELALVASLRKLDALRYRLTQIYWDVDDPEVYTSLEEGLSCLEQLLAALALAWPESAEEASP